jgi:hypothetical protein
MTVRLSARHSSAPTERIFVKFNIWIFFERLSLKFKFNENRPRIFVTLHHHHYHHHHISVMELGHLLTRSGLTYPEVSSKVCQDSFCQLGNSVSLPWVIYYKAFYLYAVLSFFCIPVIRIKLVLFLIPLQFLYFFVTLHQDKYTIFYRIALISS